MVAERKPTIALPLDLNAWHDRTFLVGLALESAQRVPWPQTVPNFGLGDGRLYRPQMLLTLLAYCYATGRLGSQEIESTIPHDPALRYLCANTRPDWNVLRRFRRFNRAHLEQCLAGVLAGAWEAQVSNLDVQRRTDLSYLGCALSRWTNPMDVPSFEDEARERVQLAIQADSMAMDE